MPIPEPEIRNLVAADKTPIYLRHWAVSNPKAVLLICHGLGEHGGRYNNYLERLLPAGFAVFAHDHRGHGRSGGLRGHTDRFDRFLDDAYLVVREARELYPNRKLFMMGHSMGGLISLAFALRHGDVLNGVIASSPALKLALDVPKVKETMGRLMSSIWPTLTLSNGLDANQLSHDPEVVRAYLEDPLVHDRVSTRFFVEFTAAMTFALNGAGALKMPLLAFHGAADGIVSPEGTKRFFEAAGSADKKFQLYEGQFHEVHNDTNKDQAIGMVLSWLEDHARN